MSHLSWRQTIEEKQKKDVFIGSTHKKESSLTENDEHALTMIKTKQKLQGETYPGDRILCQYLKGYLGLGALYVWNISHTIKLGSDNWLQIAEIRRCLTLCTLFFLFLFYLNSKRVGGSVFTCAKPWLRDTQSLSSKWKAWLCYTASYFEK